MGVLIHHATIFTGNDQDGLLYDHAVAVHGNRICEVGPERGLKEKYANFNWIDGQGRLLMPGLINAHTHFYSAYARGLALSDPPRNFFDILARFWWKLDAALDLEAVFYSALTAAITGIKKGVTTMIDHHASFHAIDGSLDRIEDALSRVGMRAALCFETSDRHGSRLADQSLRENARYIEKCRQAKKENPHRLFDAMIGLHASFTLHNRTLERAYDLSCRYNKGFHIHLAEDAVDQQMTMKLTGESLFQRLSGRKILGPDTIAAHCVHLSDDDRRILIESRAMVVHAPQSNMNNAVGVTDILPLMEKRAMVGIGTDGMSPDIKPDVRTANLAHKHIRKDPRIGWDEVRRMTLKNNPEIYERISGEKIGKIEPGYLADMIFIDYFPPTPLTSDNFWGHFLFGITDAEVSGSIINGTVVMENGKLLHIDEAEVAARSRPVAKRVWEKFYNLPTLSSLSSLKK
ncbi:MAG: hypothetical protein B6244_08715 [Candidatus Cloacimonetes bacterium 4572_55]|nr:MAG: hypothetical protein B6244_08715 [Candidatus Cloacimonetes bacterium 4572_55]